MARMNSQSSQRRLRITFFLLVMLSACDAGPGGFSGRFVRVVPESIVSSLLSPDQQGRAWLEAGEPLRAAGHFGDPLWKGIALTQAGDLFSAALLFSSLKTPRGDFMLGNALARADRLSDAVNAYQRALAHQPDFPEAAFNLDWVNGILALKEVEYEDFGGTGGQLEADEIVFDDRAKDAISEMTLEEARAQGLSAETIREIWMRRVQTTPGDFLRLKFAYQVQALAQERP